MTKTAPSLTTPRLARPILIAAMLSTALSLSPLAMTPALAGPVPESFADLVEQVKPAVVMITTSTTVSEPAGGMPGFPPGSPFEDFFKEFGMPNGPQGGPQGGPQRQHRADALGSGFVISEDGYIVTNNHVIKGEDGNTVADEISIEFANGKKLDAKIVGTDPKTDIALLKVESKEPLPFVSFGDSDKMREGDWVMAMGNPLGQGFSTSVGIVSARNRELSGTYDDYIQTDAAINRGNSGGPLFNMDGTVIGVNTAILSPNGGSIGIGFSMASNVVSKVVGQLKEFGATRRGWLGVKIQDVTPDMAEAMNLATPEGAMVSEVPEGPAKVAGIKSGDVITSFAGAPVKDTKSLTRRVADAPVGEAVDVVVMRGGKEVTLQVTLGQRELAENSDAGANTGAQAPAEAGGAVLGMTLSPITDAMRAERNLPADLTGLMVTDIDETGTAFDKGLRPGDVIVEAGQQPVAALADLQARVAEAKDGGRKSVLLLIRRDGEPRFVAVPLQ
ncbi:serine protease Do [Rhodobacter viridis]|uniref:Probable periplasmic serine endoprotease DegP-like n=1 Tax=Rhodobacter viridis TaxID=1054202 RepID=A0A318U201_9RHOB|nr:DegQ family serine endoprotease [Rhodobacter viridis]PYF10208.1 serine protease Do [Rhodobacter viridis]